MNTLRIFFSVGDESFSVDVAHTNFNSGVDADNAYEHGQKVCEAMMPNVSYDYAEYVQ